MIDGPICHQPLHGEPKKEIPIKLVEREREPEEMEPDDDGQDEPEQDNRPRSDDEVKNEYGTL